jgi:hypothetical protein
MRAITRFKAAAVALITASVMAIGIATPASAEPGGESGLPDRATDVGVLVERSDVSTQVTSSCGTWTCTVYFNKRETADIAAATSGATFVCGAIALAGGVGGVVCAGALASFIIQANRAKNRDMCLKIKVLRAPAAGFWPDIYSGGHCR